MYEYFLRGWEYFWIYTKEANVQARQMFERAIELDPEYATAYAWLGYTYLVDRVWQWSQDPQALERAFELEQKALALDDSLPLAHVVLGNVYLWKDRQYDQAIAEAERAIALDPNDADNYVTLGNMLTAAGRLEEAIESVKKALRLNPHYPGAWPLFSLGLAYRLTGQYEEAMATQKKALTRNPNYLGAHFELAILYSELGREEEARAEAAEVLRISPNCSLEVWRQSLPSKDQAGLERDLAALRKAGLK